MIGRVFVLAGGLSGAAAMSQFPEYSQQYTQRLAGKVEELTRFVADFDADARRVGLNREQALVELAQGGQMGAARSETMVDTIARRERLELALVQLRGTSALERLQYVDAFSDTELAQGTWSDFKPAVPLSLEGVIFAGGGFAAGAGIVGGMGWLWGMLFGHRRRQARVA